MPIREIREQLIRMTPVRLIAALLAIVFVTEAGIMLVLPVILSTHASRLVETGVDGFLLVVILTPVLWWTIIHPLQSGVVSEQQRAVAIMHAAFHGIITIDDAGSMESVNPEAERLFGYREEELLGKPVTLLMPERYRERHLAAFDRARSTATSAHQTKKIIEVEGLRKDGSEFPLELSMVAWQSAGAKKYAGFVRDITARKQAESALRDSEQRYRAVVENIDEIVYVVEATGDPFAGRVVFVSDRAERATGRTPEEFLENPQLWSSLIHPDDLSRVASLTHQMFSERTAVTRRYRLRHEQTDSYRWIDDRVVPQIEPDGAQLTLFGVARDITESVLAEQALKQSEERYREMFMNDLTGCFVSTPAGRLITCNPAFASMLGLASIEEALRIDLVSLWEKPGDREEFLETLGSEGRVANREIQFRRPDGKPLHVIQNAVGVFDEDGDLIETRGYLIDTTHRKQLEDQLRQAQKMEAVGQLAGGIAHDFNNLLTVINGMSELVLAQVSHDDPMHADVQEIRRAGERAATLTRQLLAFSRQQILEPRVLNFNTVVAGMESLLRRVLGEDIDLVVVPTPGLGHVKADPGQIEQVITNLAVNARDAMPQGGRVTIETQNVSIDEDDGRQHGVVVPPGPYVMLSVSDSGVGMDEATRARIFEPFFTTKGPGKGTGLGLSTVYGIVKQSHGFIWVYSEVGQGTSFKIYLPQVTEAAGTDRSGPIAVSSSGTETILLVEDNTGLLKLAARILESAGYTVLVAATGEESLLLLQRHDKPVHLLLSDVVLPGIGGRQLAERLPQTHPGMKVLYMSGYTGDTIVRHGVLEAQVAFLNKPFTAAVLLRKVREVLDSQA